MSRPRLDIDAEMPRLIRRYQEGQGIRALAGPLGISYETLVRRLREAGVMPPDVWSGEDIARLAELWGQGLPASAIGSAIGKSKNAVVGKAKRIGLPARPSPIRPISREEKARRRQEALAVKTAQLVERQMLRRMEERRRLARMAERQAANVVPLKRPADKQLRALPDALAGEPRCQYIAHEPGPDDSCKCPKAAAVGSSYCAAHHALCWIGLPKRKRRAA